AGAAHDVAGQRHPAHGDHDGVKAAAHPGVAVGDHLRAGGIRLDEGELNLLCQRGAGEIASAGNNGWGDKGHEGFLRSGFNAWSIALTRTDVYRRRYTT